MIRFPNKQRLIALVYDYALPCLFIVAFATYTSVLVYTQVYNKPSNPEAAPSDLKSQLEENSTLPQDVVQELAKKPPKHQNKGLTSQTTNGGNKTVFSEGTISAANTEYLNQLSSRSNSISTPLDLKISDTTNRYGSLVDPLKQYFASSLQWSQKELPSLYEIRLVDAGDSGWAGQYNGSYATSGGKIVAVVAWIDLNVYYYNDSPYLLDYLKLVLSHEYGHHFTLYNKWITYNLSFEVRFPDGYYQVRPLSYTTTASDYSKGWSNCDAEIIAEDYKYLFSPYKTQAMAGTYNYPSDPATRNWILSFGQVSASSDSITPTVSVTYPINNATVLGSVEFKAEASDNVGISKVDFYLNNEFIGLGSKSGEDWILNYNTSAKSNGIYNLTARAFDLVGNSKNSTDVSLTFSNSSSDTTPPVVSISSPANESTISGSTTFSANATDNIQVTSVAFKIDGNILTTKTSSPWSTTLNTLLYPNGQHTLQVIASDATGNHTNAEITVTIDNGVESDSQIPTVSISAPGNNPHTWSADNLIITASGTDNVGVIKMEFYINDTLVATDQANSISRLWIRSGTPNGTYTLKAKAYDPTGNIGETQIQIIKQ